MRIQCGNPVRGDDFFYRKAIIEEAWDMITSGNHILIAAPRRVGKTSLMYYLLDNPRENHTFLYIITESINKENEFFRRIVNKLLKTDFVKRSQKIITFLEKHKPGIKKIGPEGVEFSAGEELDYWEILNRILKSPGSDEKKLIVLLDEFPETLENIITDEGESKGRHFLQSNRELRQDSDISKNVQFIYTGSIGLENIVSGLNAINAINDLKRLKIIPLKDKEAKMMIKLLLENVGFKLTDKLVEYILQKVEWLIPFYIQLIIDELKNIYRESNLDRITEDIGEQAIDSILEQRQHFENWHTRLRASLKGDRYNFVKDILNQCSEKGTIHSNDLYNLAVKYKLERFYKDLVNSLIYDGYINNNENEEVYHYNSPILRMWWRKNVAN